MGRGRAKGKKLSVKNQEDGVSGDGEKIPAQKRGGRPQKSPRNGREEEDEGQKREDEDSEDTSGKEMKSDAAVTSDGKNRKRNAQVKDKAFEGDGMADSNESNGSRQNGKEQSLTELLKQWLSVTEPSLWFTDAVELVLVVPIEGRHWLLFSCVVAFCFSFFDAFLGDSFYFAKVPGRSMIILLVICMFPLLYLRKLYF